MSKKKKISECPKTTSGKHVWGASIWSPFIKCRACGIIFDSDYEKEFGKKKGKWV